MAKEGNIRVAGVVIDVLPNATFKVVLENKSVLLAYVSGRMRQNEIRILDGDSVEMELSPYDMTKGRIVRRL